MIVWHSVLVVLIEAVMYLTGCRRFYGQYCSIQTTGKYKGTVEIGSKHDGKWNGFVFQRFANGWKSILQFVNNKTHGTAAWIAADDILWIMINENDQLKSSTKGWCHQHSLVSRHLFSSSHNHYVGDQA